ncbi:MAG: DUF6807 family protein [Bacteroidota bacterium]
MRILLTTVPVLCLLLACVKTEKNRPNRPAITETEAGISLSLDGQDILRYHLATQYPDDSLPDYYQRSGFIHPLYTPSGNVLTSPFPEDHVHQHALFFALVNTRFRGKFTDFWNQHKETGTVRAVEISHSFENATHTGFLSVQEHLALQDGDTIVALRERWEVQATRRGKFNVVDFHSYLYPAGADSLVVKKYKYGGLGFRGNEEWNDHHFEQLEGAEVNYIGKKGKGGFLSSEGKGRIEANHSRPEWLSFHGQVAGDSVGMVIMGHPDNFRHPQPVRVHPVMPYFSVSPMVLDSFVLHPGDTLISKYRILTHDGSPPISEIEAEWERYRDAERPNIVLIMADDLGFETLTVNGGESYQTPNLDQMAREGMRFTHCYATPLCTPSRVQLMTGKYNDRNYFAFGQLDSSENTFADYLQQSGYRTAVAGKWQLYGNQKQREISGRIGSLPPQAGFDEYCLWQLTERTGPRFKDPHLNINGKDEVLEGDYGPDVFVDFLQAFMQAADERPYLSYFPMALTHDPFRPTPDNKIEYAIDSLHQKNEAKYFAENVAYMDKMVGKLLDQIRDRQENTLVLFIGDNGTDRDVSSRWRGEEIKGQKAYPLKDGTHVPMIAWWPEQIAAGQLNDNLIDFSDFLPTLLAAARLNSPDDPELDGLSFYPQLLGQADSVRPYIYCHYAPRWGKFADARWVQDKQWKLYADGRFYDIAQDPMEEVLLSENASNRAIKASFQAVLDSRP